jgi:hypothetical protein
MRIKRFNEMVDFDLAVDIANDLLPKLQAKRAAGEMISPSNFEMFMKENGADLSMIDGVMAELVNLGFDFDTEQENDSEECDTCN